MNDESRERLKQVLDMALGKEQWPGVQGEAVSADKAEDSSINSVSKAASHLSG